MKKLFCCPVCYKEYESKPEKCDCGFTDFIKEVDYFEESRDLYEKYENDLLFSLYKFTKSVFYGKIPYTPDTLDVVDNPSNKEIYIKGAYGGRGLSLVELTGNRPCVADDGILAFDKTKALIVNVDEITSNLLDESQVKILFLGPRCRIENNHLLRNSIRYLSVHSANPYYYCEDNVLFTKDKRTLLFYPNYKKEEEYRVPSYVTSIEKSAFRYPYNLKKIYVGKNVKFDKEMFVFNDLKHIDIVYI